MDKLKQEYIRKKALVTEMLNHNVQPDQNIMQELLILEQKLRESGLDPKKVYDDFLREMRDRIQRITPQHDTNPDDPDQTIDDFSKPISNQKIIIKPVNLTDDGIVIKHEGMRETGNGMEYSILNVLIIAACGKRVHGNEVAGRCDVCRRYECSDQHLFLCYEQGCETKSLCIKCVRFLEIELGKRVPYCEKHYKKAVKNLDTWKLLGKEPNKNKSEDKGQTDGKQELSE